MDIIKVQTNSDQTETIINNLIKEVDIQLLLKLKLKLHCLLRSMKMDSNLFLIRSWTDSKEEVDLLWEVTEVEWQMEVEEVSISDWKMETVRWKSGFLLYKDLELTFGSSLSQSWFW